MEKRVRTGVMMVRSCAFFILLVTVHARPQITNGFGLGDFNTFLQPLQFTLSPGQTFSIVTPTPDLASSSSSIPPSSSSTPISNAASGSLTGTALSSDISEENVELASQITAAFPSITGSALSSFISEENAPFPTVTGSALSSFISEGNVQYISEITAEFPTLTGSALSSFLTADDATAPTITGSVLTSFLSEASVEFVSEATAEDPNLTGLALSSFLSEDYGLDVPATGTAVTAESGISTSGASVPSASASGGLIDACGPKIPDPSVPDSCSTPVEQSDTPAAYGVQCLNDTQSNAAVNISSCAILIPELCANQWQKPGEWVWQTANGCSIGSLIPSETNTGAAPWPNSDQCEELIYASMVDDCQFDETPWNIAAVNLVTLPNGNDKGAAKNAGYGSYLVAERQLGT